MNEMIDFQDVKLDIVSKALVENKLDVLQKKNFFKTVSQIERANRISTHNRIWLGRMLKLVYNGTAPNHGKLAIFRNPKEYKRVRKHTRGAKWQTVMK